MPKEGKTIYPILGLLAHEDMTGYDIKKKIDTSLGFFWDVGFGQIYPTLRNLEQLGYVTKKTEEGDNRPNRIVYSLTDSGRGVLKQWLAMPAQKEYIKYEILVKLFFGSLLDKETNMDTIREFRQRYEKHPEMMGRFESELRQVWGQGKDQDHLYYLLTVLFGKRMYQAYLDWADEALQLLDGLEEHKE